MATKEFATALRLTTPHMKGQKVKDAQYLLQGHNRFSGLATYKDGKLDGDYGPLCVQATKSAKYWLGYPLAACDGVFGQTLYEYLRTHQWRPLPSEYQKRRAARLAAANNIGQKAFAEAKKFIGVKENPYGSNRKEFGAWYGFNGVPWCAIFESYCFAHSGYSKFRYAAVEMIVSDARAGRNNLSIVRTPRAGDLVAYSLHGDPYAHTAFYVEKLSATSFRDLGGNTGPSNISNGGEVLEQIRTINMVNVYVRVGK